MLHYYHLFIIIVIVKNIKSLPYCNIHKPVYLMRSGSIYSDPEELNTQSKQNGSDFFQPFDTPRDGCSVEQEGCIEKIEYSDSDYDEEYGNDVNLTESQIKEMKQYKLKQHHLLTLRGMFISNELNKRGISFPTMESVSRENIFMKENIDWRCIISTVEDPKSCLYSFDPLPNSKLIAPLNTESYISLSSLNRLYRKDPSKLEPMWHDKYNILYSWFNFQSPYCIYQYGGYTQFLISVLLDIQNGLLLKLGIMMGITTFVILIWPLIEYSIVKLLLSKYMWINWIHWARFTRSGFPLKLLVCQTLLKFGFHYLGTFYHKVRDFLIEKECGLLEDVMPVDYDDED